MKSYRGAIVGCGARGRAHAEAYRHMKRAKLVACCDPAEEKREALAREFGVKAYTDTQTMLRQERPDLVHIVTWPDTRVELMTIVSDAGVPACTVEKPIATGVADWRQLCELQMRTKTRFAVCHQCRWQKLFSACRETIRSGRLGEVRFLDLSAGMNIAGQGTHILNYGMSLNGDVPVKLVFGMAAGVEQFAGEHPAPDTTGAYIVFENGVRALWNNGDTAPRCGDPETVWKHVRMAAYADRGLVEWQEFGRWEINGPGGVESGDFGGMEEWEKNNLLAQAAFHEAVIDWLEDASNPPGTHLSQSLHEWKVVLALYASALERRPIELADFNPPDDLFERLGEALRGKE